MGQSKKQSPFELAVLKDISAIFYYNNENKNFLLDIRLILRLSLVFFLYFFGVFKVVFYVFEIVFVCVLL